jgi:cell division septal protein FtsQ
MPGMALAAPSDPILLARRRALSRARGRRRLTLLACVFGLIAAVAGYQLLKASSVFAVRSIVVRGGTPALDSQVSAAMADAVSGRNLLAVNTSPLRASILRIPYVKAARVDRAFPNTLAVTLLVERPAVVATSGHSSWLISSDGRVLAQAKQVRKLHLPRALLPSGLALKVGSVARQHSVVVALHALADTPAWFVRQTGNIAEVVAQPSQPLTLVLRGGPQVRLGSPDQLDVKLQVAARLLGTPHAGSLAYIDVSAPTRPALKFKG